MRANRCLILSCLTLAGGLIFDTHSVESYPRSVRRVWKAEQTIGWTNIYAGGVKIGYTHSYGEEVEHRGKTAYQITSESVGRWEAEKTEIHTKIILSSDGELLHYSSRAIEDGQEKLVEVSFHERVAHISITSEGIATKRKCSLPRGTIAEYAVGSKVAQEGLCLDKKFSFRVFSFSNLQPAILTCEIKKKAIIIIDGQEREIFIVEERSNVFPERISELWIDALGNVYKQKIEDLDLTIVTVSEEEAKDWESRKDIRPSLPRICANIFIPQARETEYLRARMTKRADDGTRLQNLAINIKRDKLTEVPPLSLPVRNRPDFCRPTAYALRDKHIARLAQEIISGEEDACLAVRMIIQWISDNIMKEEVDGFFTTSIRCLASKEGDCTDQAIQYRNPRFGGFRQQGPSAVDGYPAHGTRPGFSRGNRGRSDRA